MSLRRAGPQLVAACSAGEQVFLKAVEIEVSKKQLVEHLESRG